MEDCWSYLPNYSKDTEFLPLCCNKSQKNWVATVRANDSDGLFYLTGLSVSLCLCPKIERPLSELWDLCVSNGSHVTEQLILHFNLWPVRVTSSVLTSSPPQMFSYHCLFEAVKGQYPHMSVWSSWVFLTDTPQEVIFSSEFISEMIDQQAPVFLFYNLQVHC